jgi:uncharacterized protein (DUF1778 family)
MMEYMKCAWLANNLLAVVVCLTCIPKLEKENSTMVIKYLVVAKMLRSIELIVLPAKSDLEESHMIRTLFLIFILVLEIEYSINGIKLLILAKMLRMAADLTIEKFRSDFTIESIVLPAKSDLKEQSLMICSPPVEEDAAECLNPINLPLVPFELNNPKLNDDDNIDFNDNKEDMHSMATDTLLHLTVELCVSVKSGLKEQSLIKQYAQIVIEKS